MMRDTHNSDKLGIGHLPFVGAGDFDTSYAPIEFDDGQYHVRCVVNYGSFDRLGQYREGGILWVVADEEGTQEIHLVAQEGDARMILFAEDKEAGEQASVEQSLGETCYAHVAKGQMFSQLHAELAQAYDIGKWEPILQVAFKGMDFSATLEGLGYSMG